MFRILMPVLNAIFHINFFILNTYCLKDLQVIFIVIFIEGFYIVNENRSEDVSFSVSLLCFGICKSALKKD